jgi:hypothetical protein
MKEKDVSKTPEKPAKTARKFVQVGYVSIAVNGTEIKFGDEITGDLYDQLPENIKPCFKQK